MVHSRFNPSLTNYMNILFYYQSISYGGQQSQILSLMKEFRKLDNNCFWAYEIGSDFLSNIESYGTALKINTNGWKSKGYKNHFYRILKLVVNSIIRFISLRSLIKNYNIDLIITNDSYGSLVCGLSSLKACNQQFRLIGQDIEALERPWFDLYKILQIDRFVTKYFGWSKPYNSLIKKGVSEKKLVNFQVHAVDIEKFSPQSENKRNKIRKKLGISNNDLVIGWVGRLESRMQVMNTILLGEELKKRGLTKYKLLIVGGGMTDTNGNYDQVYPKFLCDKVVSLGISKHTIFTGWVPFEDVCDYLVAMDIVPLLELDPQGGSILREAMACGKVTLSVDGISGTQRAFMNHDNSLLVSPERFLDEAAEAIISLATLPDERENIGRRARAYAEENFSFSVQAKSILNYAEPTSNEV